MADILYMSFLNHIVDFLIKNLLKFGVRIDNK